MNERSKLIARLKSDKKFRVAYIKAKLGVLVPAQIRGLRLKSNNPSMPRQKDLAREAEMHQSRISMFETPGAANVTLETLANLASALRSGLVVKFVPFSEMLKWENDFSQDTFDVVRLDNDTAFIEPAAVSQGEVTEFALPVSVGQTDAVTQSAAAALWPSLNSDKKPPQPELSESGIRKAGAAWS